MNRKTIFFTGKEQIEVREEPVEPPRAGELLLQTTRTLISTGTEGIVLTGNFSPGTHWDRWVSYPFRAGYSHAGRVVGIGEGVEGWKIGDRAATYGGHTSYEIVQATQAVRIPEGVSDEDATWAALGSTTQIGARTANHIMGDSVVVIGLGLLGQLVNQYARLLGALDVIAVDTAPRRLEMAAAHGATETLQMSAADALPHVERITRGRRADVVYDVTGNPVVFATALPLARDLGTLVLLGDAGNPQEQRLTPDVIKRGVRIAGAHMTHAPAGHTPGVRWSRYGMRELFLTYLQRGQMRVKDLNTHRYKPEQASEAYTMLQRERATAMGVIFEWA